MTVPMRLALKIAYDGRAFFGHQRQPDARTVEGECLRALKAAGILRDPKEAFFRSASRTDRGVSAVGNVIAFHSSLPAEATVGAFNDKARDVWAWAVAEVPDDFHPRRAVERWYRYHLFEELPLVPMREAATAFEGEHDFRSFTSEPAERPLSIRRIEVRREGRAILVDVYAKSFRRGMVRRIVAALAAHARGDATIEEIRGALRGTKRDFGSVPAEPLFLMDVRFPFDFRIVLKPKVLHEWRAMEVETDLRSRWLRSLRHAAHPETSHST